MGIGVGGDGVGADVGSTGAFVGASVGGDGVGANDGGEGVGDCVGPFRAWISAAAFCRSPFKVSVAMATQLPE